jgi:hypothetical protein
MVTSRGYRVSFHSNGSPTIPPYGGKRQLTHIWVSSLIFHIL